MRALRRHVRLVPEADSCTAVIDSLFDHLVVTDTAARLRRASIRLVWRAGTTRRVLTPAESGTARRNTTAAPFTGLAQILFPLDHLIAFFGDKRRSVILP